MADSQKSDGSSRRSFLKIGAGVVVGAVVAGAGVAAYESSVIGSNNSSSSSTVASLSAELTTTQSQLSDANSQISTLSGQLSSTQGALSSASAQLATLQSQATSASSQASALQIQLDTITGFLYLNSTEQAELAAALETIIPTDSNGPGANTAGVIYFIDRQLASDYGTNGTMYMQGPFFLPNQSASITLNGTTYSEGTPKYTQYSGAGYQYSLNMRYFWRWSLDALESYSNSAYGGNYESLSAADQAQALQDLWNNKPTSFNSIVPADFAYELFMMAWSGFLSDPLYGGNRNMVGWAYTGYSGVNQGNFYGEGYTLKELMVMTTPVPLKPASLAQYQKGSP